jgi:peroxiredoxin
MGDPAVDRGEEPVALRIGEPVNDLTFLRPDGTALPLADLRGQPLLLIFLRHLA